MPVNYRGPFLAGGFPGQVLVKDVTGSNRTIWTDPENIVTAPTPDFDRELLSANRIYYVASATSSPSGSDSNDGSLSRPFATIQHAIDVVAALDIGQFSVTVQLADGTHEVAEHPQLRGLQFKDPLGGGSSGLTPQTAFPLLPCTLLGNQANPPACIITSHTNNYFLLNFDNSHKWHVSGVRLQSPYVLGLDPVNGPFSAAWLIWASASYVYLSYIDFHIIDVLGSFIYSYSSKVYWVEDTQYASAEIVGAQVEIAWIIDQSSEYFDDGFMGFGDSTIEFWTWAYVTAHSLAWIYEKFVKTIGGGFPPTTNITTRDYRLQVTNGSTVITRKMSTIPGPGRLHIELGSSVWFSTCPGSVTRNELTVIDPSGSLMGGTGPTPSDHTILQYNGSTFTNQGATAISVYNLPPIDSELSPTDVNPFVFSYVVQNAFGIRIVAPAGHSIRIAGSVSAAGGKCESTAIGSVITLRCINLNEWVATSCLGTWTLT